RRQRQGCGWSCGLLDARVDLVAKQYKIDRLRKQRVSATFERFALCFSVTIGCDHDDRHVRPGLLGLGQKLKPAHSRHVDIGQDQYERSIARIADTLQRDGSGLREFHGKATGAEIASKMLPKQHLNIGLVVDNENKKFHAGAPVLASIAALR